MWKRNSIVLCTLILTIIEITGSFTVKSPEPLPSPSYVAGVIIVIIVAATILYFGWKGKIPEMYPEIGDEIK